MVVILFPFVLKVYCTSFLGSWHCVFCSHYILGPVRKEIMYPISLPPNYINFKGLYIMLFSAVLWVRSVLWNWPYLKQKKKT